MPYAKILLYNKKDKNLNTDLDKDFEQAYKLSGDIFTQDELIEFLNTGNIQQKQIAALKLTLVRDKNDAEALTQNLTGCDGKIREAVAYRIHQLISEGFGEFFAGYPLIFADATIDINANICRQVADSARMLKGFGNFSTIYVSQIINYAKDALDALDKIVYRDKKYIINKQLFKLYWCLETLVNFYEFIDNNTLIALLKECSLQNEYTIREKTAEIVHKSGLSSDLYERLRNDENYYVRAVFLNH